MAHEESDKKLSRRVVSDDLNQNDVILDPHGGHVNLTFSPDRDVEDLRHDDVDGGYSEHVQVAMPLRMSLSIDASDQLVMPMGLRLRRQLRNARVRHVVGSDTDDDGAAPTDRVRRSLWLQESTLIRDRTTRLKSHNIQRIFIKEELEQENQLLAGKKTDKKGLNKWKYNRFKEWKRTKRSTREFFDNLNLWQRSFKTIEGRFGSSVVSYFQFLKWLLLLNLFTFVCLLAAVILPQALMDPNNFNETLYMDNTQGHLTRYESAAAECSTNYTLVVSNASVTEGGSGIIDFFQGTGFMEDTYLFIGHYFNKTLYYDDSAKHYNMPLAYLLITAGYLLTILFFMVHYTAQGVKEKLISKGDKFYKSSSLVFCGWDYNLTQEKAAQYKHSSLFQELSRELYKQQRKELWRSMASSKKCVIYFVRVLVNLLTLVILSGCAALIYFVVEVWKPQLLEWESVKSNNVLQLGVEYLPSLTITVLNVIFPFLFEKIVIIERYAPGIELRITIIRTVLLRLSSLVVLAVTLLNNVTCPEDERNCGNCNGRYCWETYVGQELYKLVILDFLVVLAITFAVEFPRKLFITKVPKFKAFEQEFDIPVNVLNIVYSQTLSWWGGFYSPLIPGITVVKFLVFFYCKKLSLIKNQLVPERSLRASKSNEFFMVVLMMSFTLSSLAIAYTVGKIPPSQGCSPFRIYSRHDYKMFHSVTDAVDTLPTIVQQLFKFIASLGFYVVLLVITILCIYYYTAKSAGSKKVLKLLNEQLGLVEKDKQFLIKRVNEAMNRGAFTEFAN